MVRVIGLFTIFILVGAGITELEYLTGGDFIETSLRAGTLEIMATILGLNLATGTVLLGNLTNIEIQVKKSLFRKSKKEVKANLLLMTILFVITILILSIGVEQFGDYKGLANFIKNTSNVTLLLFYAYAFWEMTNAVFDIDEFTKSLTD